MAWVNRVLVVLEDVMYKDELKAKWEIIRPEDGNGKHYAAGLAKTSYYKNKTDGALTRGFPQILTKYDMDWIDKNRTRINEAIAAKHDAIGMTPKPAPVDDAVEDVPF